MSDPIKQLAQQFYHATLDKLGTEEEEVDHILRTVRKLDQADPKDIRLQFAEAVYDIASAKFFTSRKRSKLLFELLFESNATNSIVPAILREELSGVALTRAEDLYYKGHDTHRASRLTYFTSGAFELFDLSNNMDKAIALAGISFITGACVAIPPLALIFGAEFALAGLASMGMAIYEINTLSTEGEVKEAYRDLGKATSLTATSFPFFVPFLPKGAKVLRKWIGAKVPKVTPPVEQATPVVTVPKPPTGAPVTNPEPPPPAANAKPPAINVEPPGAQAKSPPSPASPTLPPITTANIKSALRQGDRCVIVPIRGASEATHTEVVSALESVHGNDLIVTTTAKDAPALMKQLVEKSPWLQSKAFPELAPVSNLTRMLVALHQSLKPDQKLVFYIRDFAPTGAQSEDFILAVSSWSQNDRYLGRLKFIISSDIPRIRWVSDPHRPFNVGRIVGE